MLRPRLLCLAGYPGPDHHHSEPQFPHLANGIAGLPYSRSMLSTAGCQPQLVPWDVRWSASLQAQKPGCPLGVGPWAPGVAEPACPLCLQARPSAWGLGPSAAHLSLSQALFCSLACHGIKHSTHRARPEVATSPYQSASLETAVPRPPYNRPLTTWATTQVQEPGCWAWCSLCVHWVYACVPVCGVHVCVSAPVCAMHPCWQHACEWHGYVHVSVQVCVQTCAGLLCGMHWGLRGTPL